MKNYIYINYGIKVDKIYIKDNKKYFFISNVKVYIYESKLELFKLRNLFDLTNNLYRNKILVNTFIINNRNEFYTKKDDYYILLLKVNDIENIVDLNEFIKFMNIQNNLENINILEVWKNDIDTIEKEIIEYNKEYNLIQNSINYFIGLAENAIELLGNYKNEILNNNDSIGHRVNYKLFKNYSLNNPFTFIKINKMYDMSNYIKYKFYNNKIDYDEIDYIFNNIAVSDYDKIYLFSCLLYPNIYIDIVKNILLKKEEETKINIYIKKVNDYEKLLYYCKMNVKNEKLADVIDWISE